MNCQLGNTLDCLINTELAPCTWEISAVNAGFDLYFKASCIKEKKKKSRILE